MNKQALLDWAELIDSWRVYPRLFLAGCLYWTISISYTLLVWYQSLPKDERGIEASGFASVVFLTVFGFMKLVYQTYSDAGRDWNAQPARTQTTVTSAQTTTVQPAVTP